MVFFSIVFAVSNFIKKDKCNNTFKCNNNNRLSDNGCCCVGIIVIDNGHNNQNIFKYAEIINVENNFILSPICALLSYFSNIFSL